MKTSSLDRLIKVADQLDVVNRNKKQDYPDAAPPPKTWDERKQDFKTAWTNVGYPLLKTIPDTVQDVQNAPRYAVNSVVNGITGFGWDGTYGLAGYVPPDSTQRLHDGLVSQPIVLDALGRTIDTGLTRIGDRFSSHKIAPIVERSNALAHDKLRRDLYWNDDAYNYNKPAEDLEAQVMQLLLLRGAGKAGTAIGKVSNDAWVAKALGTGAPIAFETAYKSGLSPTMSGSLDTRFKDDMYGWIPDPNSYVEAPIQNYTGLFDMYKFWSPMAAAGAGKVARWFGNDKVGPYLSNATDWVGRAVHGNLAGNIFADASKIDDAKQLAAQVTSRENNPFMQRQKMFMDMGWPEQAQREWDLQYNMDNPDSYLRQLDRYGSSAKSSLATDAALAAFFGGLDVFGAPAYLVPAGVGVGTAAKPYVEKAWRDWNEQHKDDVVEPEDDSFSAYKDPFGTWTTSSRNSVPDRVSM